MIPVTNFQTTKTTKLKCHGNRQIKTIKSFNEQISGFKIIKLMPQVGTQCLKALHVVYVILPSALISISSILTGAINLLTISGEKLLLAIP